MNMEHFDDDDFGELYAHVELPALTHSSPLCIEPQEDDAKNHGKDDFAPDEVKAEVENGDEEFVGSESEDDLNIVLNDEDCASFPVRNDGVGCDEDDSDEAVRVIDRGILGNNGKSGDHVADGVADHCRSGFKSQFFHHKYVRRGSALADNTKVSKHMGLVSYPSPFTKGGRSAQVRAGANQMTVQCGYRSYLPWHWSIFDVDIDALEEKPWRIPGVDITDYFNFGFDENTWKRYCVSLKQNWEEFMQTGSAVNKSPKNNLDSMKEQTEQAVSGSPLSTALGCELPKGRAIQVEESMFERQSSMDVWRPRLRDSDVVIQIKVLESSDDYSGSDNSNVRESSEEGEFCAGNKINIPRSVSEHDNDLSQEPSEDVKNSGDSSTEERKDPVAGVDKKKERQDRMDKCSEDTAEASEDESKAEEGIDLGTCSIESQLSFGDQDLSLTSYSDSESVNSVHADNEMRHQRRQLEKSLTDLKESAPSDCKIPKNSRSNRKEENMDYYSRKNGPIRQEWRPLCRNYDPGSKLHKFSEKYEVFSKPMSGVRELSLLDHKFMNYGKKSVQLQDYYGGHKRRDIPFYEETEQSYHHDDGKVVDDMVQTTYSYRDDHDRFRENTNRDLRREWDEEDYIFENRIVMKDDDREQNWYHADGGYSADEVSPLSYREPRKFMSKHWSFPAKERNMQRRRRNEMPYLRDRNSDKDNWFNECGRDFVDKSYTTSIEREVESLDSKYEHRLLEPQRSVRRERHHVRPSLELNSLWSRRIEDECQEYTSHQTSGLSYCREFYPDSQKASAYVKGVSEYLRHPGRWKHTRDVKGSDWYSNIIDDALEDEDFLFDPEKECDLGSRRYSSPSEVLDWIGDDVILRHRDGFHADEETLYYEETSWHKGTYARYESLHDEMETDDIQLQHDYLNMPRRGSDNCIKRHYKIARRDKHGQANSRSSIDFVKGDGKFHGRSSRTRSLMCGGRIENLDQGFAKKRTTMGLYKTHNDKATKFESIHNGWKRLHSVPAKKHEGPEAGEGKIVTEEPCMVDSVNRNDLPEGESLTGSKRMRTLQDENNVYQDDNKGGYDNQRIMETLAKMEKRRERFKEPIALIKEEKSLKPDDGLIVGTDETNQIRPLRKRRWGGN